MGLRRGGKTERAPVSRGRVRSGAAGDRRLPVLSSSADRVAPAVPMPGLDAQSKYLDLARKYRAMLRQVRARTNAGTDFARLSSWAMRLPASGLLLVRDGVIAISNAAFNNLCHTAGGPLVREPLALRDAPPRDGGRRYRDLREIATVEAEALEGAAVRGVTSRRYRAVDAQRWIEAMFERVSDSDRCVVAMFHDVTARVAAEAELVAVQDALLRQEQMRAVGELAAGIVHDVSNTLAAIRLRLSALRRDPSCMSSQGGNIEALERILQEGTEMLRKLQRLGHSDEHQAAELVDLAEIVGSAIEVAQSGLRYRAIHDGVDIRIEHNVPRLPKVVAWRDDLQRAFVNLLINARDAMRMGGRIRVSGAPRAHEIVIEVEDEGAGIPPAVLSRIFEPYFTTKGQSGTGMGLVTVQRVMARLGGSISAVNRQGGGAVFTLRFPLGTRSTTPTGGV
jgi:signal transduction histidine kinase